MSDYGKPNTFDVKKYLEVVDQLVLADEVAFAIEMLKNVPAYYRDYPTVEMREKLKELHELTYSIWDYTRDKDEEKAEGIEQKINSPFCQPRGTVIEQIVLNYNKQGFKPHLLELGPFDYWLPYGLKAKGLDFTYEPISMTPRLEEQNRFILGDKYIDVAKNTARPLVFICFEVIEHMWRPEDIPHLMDQKLGMNQYPDVVAISTPKYTMGGGLESLKGNKFGHLRTYTPNELLKFCFDNFKYQNKNYKWYMIDSPQMLCVGSKDLELKIEV